ncbi:hypothetical protein NEPAR04_2214 [Nematocida parisii]|nr:hypothetical protein NEPAR04_2214 [Nematocida parisii]KAI5193051.1 hypothetical protein NECID01_2167 [Nematocida sp. AWRm77]
MKKIAVILMLIGFAVVSASHVEVELTLKNKTSIRVAVPEGAFQMIDNQAMLAPLGAENDGSISKEAAAEKYTPAAWCAFESMSEYEQFRKLWDIDFPALSTKDSASAQGQASHTADLTADLFEKCLITANYLNIQGEYAKCFSENMVKYGLLGTNSADIVSSEVFSNYDLSHDTSRDLLYVFLRQAGFEYRHTHPSTGQAMLRIEKNNAWPRKIDEEYTGPSQTAKMRTVLHSRLGPALSPEKKRNEAVLAWLLLNMGGSSVDIQYTIEVFSDSTIDHTQPIKQFTKENEKGPRVYVEGLTLDVDYRSNSSLIPAIQLVPGLSRPELSSTPIYNTPSAALSSLISDISSCRSLKTLKLTGCVLGSAEVSSLVESFPNVEQLSLSCKILDSTAVDSLKKCVQLEKLNIYGVSQPSTTVQALLTRLPLLKDLAISCNALTPAATEAFQTLTQLEKLNIYGVFQPSATVQALLKHLPLLSILIIKIDTADFALADALQKYCNLRSLELRVDHYTPGFLARYLQSLFPRLDYLILYNYDRNNRFSEEDKRAEEEAQNNNISVCLVYSMHHTL